MERESQPPPRLERRAKPRVAIPFQARVSGRDRAGTPFELTTTVDNLSHGGLYLRIARDVCVGSRLLVDVFMNPQLGGPDWGGLSLEVYGLVERVDHAAGDGFGVAVSFTSSVFR